IYGDLTDKQIDRLSRVNRSGNHLLLLISDVLDLSKIEAGQLELEKEELDINQLIQDVSVNITPQVEAKDLSLDVTVAPKLPIVEADVQRVRQVVTNLMGNAVKFTPKGFVSLTVEPVHIHDGEADYLDIPANVDAEDGTWLAMIVADSGIGIREEDQHMIFNAFQQVDGNTNRQYEGTGLGLAIAKQIVEMHGGHLWVESEENAGSVFTVLLPARPIFERDLVELTSGGDDRPMVLVVDDDLASLQLTQDYLSGGDYRVMCTNNPYRALHLAERHNPVAMVLDLMMPSMDGLDLLSRLKASGLRKKSRLWCCQYWRSSSRQPSWVPPVI
ncbi:MAG: ATP-binding protein, partial [Chloroflexota bacterium]